METGKINDKTLFEELQTNLKNYEDSVQVMQALLIFFDQNNDILDANGTALGRKLETTVYSVNKEVKPDIISTYDNGDKGLLTEIKWSISENFQYMTDEISELNKYSSPLIGWKKIFPHLIHDTVTFHDLILLCHSDVCRKVKNCIGDLIKDDTKTYTFLKSKNFAVWSFTEQKDRKGIQVIRIRNEYGKIFHKRLHDISKDKIDIPQFVACPIRIKVIFTSDTPPDAYVIQEVMKIIYYIVCKSNTDELKISEEDIYNMFIYWYPPYNKNSTLSINKVIIKDACEKIVRFNYNLKKMGSENVKNEELDPKKIWYVAAKKLPKGKLLNEWIIKRLIKLQREDEERKRKQEEKRRKSEQMHRVNVNGKYKQKNITEY